MLPQFLSPEREPGKRQVRALKTSCSVLSLLLASCGGGGDSGGDIGSIVLPSFNYGAVAVDTDSGAAGITANYPSQRRANDEALNQCRISNIFATTACQVVLEFESGRCAALARGLTPRLVFGWASDRRAGNAEAQALSQCTSRGGGNCSIALRECNS